MREEEILQSRIEEFEDCYNRQPTEEILLQWRAEILQLFEDGIYDQD